MSTISTYASDGTLITIVGFSINNVIVTNRKYYLYLSQMPDFVQYFANTIKFILEQMSGASIYFSYIDKTTYDSYFYLIIVPETLINFKSPGRPSPEIFSVLTQLHRDPALPFLLESRTGGKLLIPDPRPRPRESVIPAYQNIYAFLCNANNDELLIFFKEFGSYIIRTIANNVYDVFPHISGGRVNWFHLKIKGLEEWKKRMTILGINNFEKFNNWVNTLLNNKMFDH